RSAETFGCSIPRIVAAAAWVRARASTISEIFAASSALARASSGAATPRSAKTLRVLTLKLLEVVILVLVLLSRLRSPPRNHAHFGISPQPPGPARRWASTPVSAISRQDAGPRG